MLQAPVYVSLENQTIDINNEEQKRVTFTFNGDYLTGVRYRFIDYNTGAIVSEYENTNATVGKIIAYNGETVTSDLYNLENGKSYVLQMMLTQGCKLTSKHDMMTLRGTLRTEYVVDTDDGKYVEKIEHIGQYVKVVSKVENDEEFQELKFENNTDYNCIEVAVDYGEYSIATTISDDKDVKSLIALNSYGEILYQQNTNGYYKPNEDVAKIIINSKGEMPTITKIPSPNGNLPVEKGIANIYEWDKVNEPLHNGWRYPTDMIRDASLKASLMTLEIGGEKYTIYAYNEELGLLGITPAIDHNIPRGTPYVIYSNYIITPQYYFQTCETPVIYNEKLDIVGKNKSNFYAVPYDILFEADYDVESDTLIDYYTVDLYTGDTTSCLTEANSGTEITTAVWQKISSSPRQYSQKISSRFSRCIYRPFTTDDEGRLIGRSYKAILNIVFSNKMTLQKRAYFTLLPNPTTISFSFSQKLIIENNPNKKDEHGNSIAGTMIKSTVERSVSQKGEFVLTRLDQRNRKLHEASAYDCTISNKGNYEYAGMIVYRDDSNSQWYFYTGLQTKAAYLDIDGWTISKLTKDASQPFSKPVYLAGETWRFEGDIANTTITHNGDRTSHVQYQRYTTQTSTNTKYQSGNVSAMLGFVDCHNEHSNGMNLYQDDIYYIEQFYEFITQPSMFLLKSPKGDVFVVNITESSREYEDYHGSPTKINFSWVECENIDNLIIYKDIKVYTSS